MMEQNALWNHIGLFPSESDEFGSGRVMEDYRGLHILYERKRERTIAIGSH